MKIISILLFIAGLIVTIGLIIFYRSAVNVVNADPMTIDRHGYQVSEWPLFIGLILLFVGSVFYYVSHDQKSSN